MRARETVSVDTYRQLAQIDVKRELVVQQVEHLVLGSGLHEVESAANVLGRALGDELERQSIAASCGTVSRGVVGSIENTVRGTALVIRANRRVPGVARVAVRVAVFVVNPPPVGICNDCEDLLSNTLVLPAIQDLPITTSPLLVVQLDGEVHVW